MTILSDYQKYMTEKKLQKNKLKKQYFDNQLKQNEIRNRTLGTIPDMSQQLRKVRQDKTTISKDYQKLTSSFPIV